MKIRLHRRAAPRVLDLDIENRPLAYLGPDFTTAEITAIACSWEGHPPNQQAGAGSVQHEVFCWLLGRDDPRQMLIAFRGLYRAADVVTGHYILKHDLPVLNGAMLEYGLSPLEPKWVSDTKLHLKNRRYISASQESLAGMLGLAQEKDHMSNPQWREANRLTPAGLMLTRDRVVHDVVQHKALRAKLLELGWLNPPKPWRP